MKKNPAIITILFCLLSCNNRNETNQLKRIDFIKSVSKEYESKLELKQGEYLIFKFLNLYYKNDTDTSDYSRALFITVPVNDTAFTFKNDSTHKFIHAVSDCRGLCDIKTEEINSAEIKGKLMDKERWLIEAKTKYFEFKRTIPLVYKTLEIETIRL